MLIRISLIIAIVAGLAVGGLSFFKVKDTITGLRTDLATEKTARASAESQRDKNKRELDKTTAELTQTQQTLATTSAEKEKALSDVAALTRKANQLSSDLDKTRKDRDDARDELAAYAATGLKPDQILTLNKQLKQTQDALEASIAEKKLIDRELARTKAELLEYKEPDNKILLPASLKGKILVSDPKWDFVVLNVGGDQDVLTNGELLVSRHDRLVAKVRVTSVQKDRSIANVMPGWKLGDVMEGDEVIPAYPKSD